MIQGEVCPVQVRGLLCENSSFKHSLIGLQFFDGIEEGAYERGNISSAHNSPFVPTSYLLAQAKVVDIILNELNGGDTSRVLIIIMGANHVIYDSQGIGVPLRVCTKMATDSSDLARVLTMEDLARCGKEFLNLHATNPEMLNKLVISDRLWKATLHHTKTFHFGAAEVLIN